MLHTSAPSFAHDVKVAEALRGGEPAGCAIGFVGAHVAVARESALAASPAIEFVAGAEFDFTIQEIAEGRPLDRVAGLSYRTNGTLVARPSAPPLEDMDRLPFVVDVYKRDLDVERLLHRLPAASLRLALHRPRLPLEVHLLPVAADGGRSPLSHAHGRARGRRDRARAAALSRR